MSDRYKSRGRKERTPEQLKVLAMAREKARLVIAERTKIKREMADPPPTVSPPPEPEPVEAEPQPPTPQEIPEPEPEPEPKPPEPRAEHPSEVSVPPSLSRDEIQNLIHSTLDERRPHERKYAFVDGMYVKIK